MKNKLNYKIINGILLLTLSYKLTNGATILNWEQNVKSKANVMADSLNKNLKCWTVPGKIFKVDAFGAIPDGIALNTIAIQKAIDSCSISGGGTVLFSAGDYLTGTLELRSGVMLEITSGSRILGSTNLKDYPEKIESFKSVMSENHKYRQSLIYAENVKNTGICGKGEIYFRGEKRNFAGPQTTGEIIGRPFGIRMIQCSNVFINDILLHNAAAWMQSYIFCNDMIFDGMRVQNHANFNNDGIDVDGCTNVIIRNCFINSEDDALCLKGCSGKPTSNILIENCTSISTCNAFKIGTDTQGDFFNIIVRNCILGGIPDSLLSSSGRQSSTGITLATVDGGNVENIYIHDVTINQSRCPVFIRIGNRLRVINGAPKPAPGFLRKIVIENVNGNNNFRQGSFISGIKGHHIEDVIIRNFKISMAGGGLAELASLPVTENESGYPDAHQFSPNGLPSYGFFIRHARNCIITDASIHTMDHDQRPCFVNGGNIENCLANDSAIKKHEVSAFSYKAKFFNDILIHDNDTSFKILPFKNGVQYYSDRSYIVNEIPEILNSAEFICWRNDLKMSDSGDVISFSLNNNGTLFIAHDDRLQRPQWLLSDFKTTNLYIDINGAKVSLFTKPVLKKNKITLGPNQIKGTATGMSTNYVVFFVPEK